MLENLNIVRAKHRFNSGNNTNHFQQYYNYNGSCNMIIDLVRSLSAWSHGPDILIQQTATKHPYQCWTNSTLWGEVHTKWGKQTQTHKLCEKVWMANLAVPSGGGMSWFSSMDHIGLHRLQWKRSDKMQKQRLAGFGLNETKRTEAVQWRVVILYSMV